MFVSISNPAKDSGLVEDTVVNWSVFRAGSRCRHIVICYTNTNWIESKFVKKVNLLISISTQEMKATLTECQLVASAGPPVIQKIEKTSSVGSILNLYLEVNKWSANNLFSSTVKVLAGGVAEPSHWICRRCRWAIPVDLPEGCSTPHPPEASRRLTCTLTVRVGTPEAHVRLSPGHHNSIQNEGRTKYRRGSDSYSCYSYRTTAGGRSKVMNFYSSSIITALTILQLQATHERIPLLPSSPRPVCREAGVARRGYERRAALLVPPKTQSLPKKKPHPFLSISFNFHYNALSIL